jgi:hypothetical protein
VRSRSSAGILVGELHTGDGRDHLRLELQLGRQRISSFEYVMDPNGSRACVAADVLRGFGDVPQGADELGVAGYAAGKKIHRAWRETVGPVAALSVAR